MRFTKDGHLGRARFGQHHCIYMQVFSLYAEQIKMIVTITSFLILLCLNSVILYWLLRLDRIKCKCALNWQHKCLLAYSILSIFMLVCLMYGVRKDGQFFVIELLFTFAGAVNVMVSLHYIYTLRSTKCDCSQHVGREILYILTILRAFVWGALVLLVSLLFMSVFAKVKSYIL
jgi:hypothetical protein